MHDPQLEGDVCDNCAFFRCFSSEPLAGHEEGECRRYPPVFTPINQGDGAWIERFPKVHACAWCGEFKKAEWAKESEDGKETKQ